MWGIEKIVGLVAGTGAEVRAPVLENPLFPHVLKVPLPEAHALRSNARVRHT